VLVIGQTKGFEHDSVSDAMVAIFEMGRESGLWETMLRTDTELLLKSRRVVPGRLLEAGFSFDHPTWRETADDLVAAVRDRPRRP